MNFEKTKEVAKRNIEQFLGYIVTVAGTIEEGIHPQQPERSQSERFEPENGHDQDVNSVLQLDGAVLNRPVKK